MPLLCANLDERRVIDTMLARAALLKITFPLADRQLGNAGISTTSIILNGCTHYLVLARLTHVRFRARARRLDSGRNYEGRISFDYTRMRSWPSLRSRG